MNPESKSNSTNLSIKTEYTSSISTKLSPPGSPISYTHSLNFSYRTSDLHNFYILTPWIALLLVFIPLGYVAYANHWGGTWIFVLNFLAIIPLAILFEYATDDISLRFGQPAGDLLVVTFSNTVEIIISTTALKVGQIQVVQASILGSIILNLLLVLGISFTRGGISSKTQKFNQIAAQTNSNLMALACIALIIPAAFASSLKTPDDYNEKLLYFSYGTAIVLLIIYVLYLVFQLKTHSHIFQRGRKEIEKPKLPLVISLILLTTVTIAVAFSEFLVGSIEEVVDTFGISRTFIGLIILPIVNKSSHLLHTLSAAAEDEIDLDFTISLAAGSSMHIAFFVSPLLVILGWITGKEMTLFFQVFETIILFISVMMTNYLVQNGESNWLKGALFLATYIIVAIAFFFYPNIPIKPLRKNT
ncbi:hypothetical protein RclHR1_07870003 [Rhizophagus clarus]|uniref:Vacuolar calcium ion transporter n=1 Tax=Rhizophagus clarus TaxID=94130 RepID=A0A2Z6SDE3_9GLOM|nr:hypothetical protein RclHR1_07870003 [Rhizophagus clarus]GET04080.1 sodium/calcium exchanger protein-domain-containing protein [Rhizophagus clarus]